MWAEKVLKEYWEEDSLYKKCSVCDCSLFSFMASMIMISIIHSTNPNSGTPPPSGSPPDHSSPSLILPLPPGGSLCPDGPLPCVSLEHHNTTQHLCTYKMGDFASRGVLSSKLGSLKTSFWIWAPTRQLTIHISVC